MKRNPDYWRGEAKMSRVVLRHFQESQTLRLMIEKATSILPTIWRFPILTPCAATRS